MVMPPHSQQFHLPQRDNSLKLSVSFSEESYTVIDYALRDQIWVGLCQPQDLNLSPIRSTTSMLGSRQTGASHLFQLRFRSNHSGEKVPMILGTELLWVHFFIRWSAFVLLLIQLQVQVFLLAGESCFPMTHYQHYTFEPKFHFIAHTWFNARLCKISSGWHLLPEWPPFLLSLLYVLLYAF